MAGKVYDQLQKALEQLKRAQEKNDSLQRLVPQASAAWHTHEDIDDDLHDVTAYLEAKLEEEEGINND